MVPVAGDMLKLGDIETVMTRVQNALGPVDILVNNAGSSPMGRIAETEDTIWEKCLQLKLLGYVRCARAVLPSMRARRWGRVVNIIGRSGHQPRAAYLAGGAVNAALLNFTLALAEECAPDNVLVTGVNPGPVQTPRWDTLVSQDAAIARTGPAAANAAALASVPSDGSAHRRTSPAWWRSCAPSGPASSPGPASTSTAAERDASDGT